MNLMASESYDVEKITRLLVTMRDNCISGDAYDDPHRREKYDALNAVIDLISNPSLLVKQPMTGDLISREAAMQLARNHIGHTIDINDIARIPAVDAVPVVHGRWYKPTGMMPPEHHGRHRCSVCGHMAFYEWPGREALPDYCPNCGADMRGEEEHGPKE